MNIGGVSGSGEQIWIGVGVGGGAKHSSSWGERGLCCLKLSHPRPPRMPGPSARDGETHLGDSGGARPLLTGPPPPGCPPVRPLSLVPASADPSKGPGTDGGWGGVRAGQALPPPQLGWGEGWANDLGPLTPPREGLLLIPFYGPIKRGSARGGHAGWWGRRNCKSGHLASEPGPGGVLLPPPPLGPPLSARPAQPRLGWLQATTFQLSDSDGHSADQVALRRRMIGLPDAWRPGLSLSGPRPPSTPPGLCSGLSLGAFAFSGSSWSCCPPQGPEVSWPPVLSSQAAGQALPLLPPAAPHHRRRLRSEGDCEGGG